jgi:hypothetical protein
LLHHDPHGQKFMQTKTYNSGYSLLVTHATTNPPVHCLYMAERTGSLVFSVLWSYVIVGNVKNCHRVIFQSSSLIVTIRTSSNVLVGTTLAPSCTPHILPPPSGYARP